MLYMHHRGSPKGVTGSEVIGRWEHIRIEGYKLLADAVFDTEDSLAQKISRKVKEGFLRGASIGIEVLDRDYTNKKEKKEPVEVIYKSILVEASIVDIPRNENSLSETYPSRSNRCFQYAPIAMKSSSTQKKVKTQQEQEKTKTQEEEEIKALQKEIQDLRIWKEEFLKKEAEDWMKLALKEGWIDEEEQQYCQKLFASDFSLGRQFLLLQKNNSSSLPPTAVQFLKDLSKNPKPSSQIQSSEYENTLKNNPEELKRLRKEDPQRFRGLLEKHLSWKQKKQTPTTIPPSSNQS